jgi:flagellar protein FliS
MIMTTELSYRTAAIGGASTIGLIIVLFDTLAGDLRRAAAAIRKNDIETRCKELNHASLVLGQLETWIDLKNGGESASTLSRFYAYLRAKMMEAAGSKSAKLLETQIEMILHVRTAWQLLDGAPQRLTERPEKFAANQVYPSFTPEPLPEPDRIPFSQSA